MSKPINKLIQLKKIQLWETTEDVDENTINKLLLHLLFSLKINSFHEQLQFQKWVQTKMPAPTNKIYTFI